MQYIIHVYSTSYLLLYTYLMHIYIFFNSEIVDQKSISIIPQISESKIAIFFFIQLVIKNTKNNE